MQAGDGKIGDAGEHIGEPRLCVDVVETAGRDDGEHDGGSIGPALGAGEGPVSTPERNSSQSALGRIVRETNPAIFQETGKAIPALQHVIDRLDHLGRFAEHGALPFQPLVHVIEQRLALFLPRGQPFCGAQSIDLAFDIKQRLVPLDGLQCDRRDRLAFAFAVTGTFLDVGKLKEFAPRVRMTKCEGDRYPVHPTTRWTRCAPMLGNATLPIRSPRIERSSSVRAATGYRPQGCNWHSLPRVGLLVSTTARRCGHMIFATAFAVTRPAAWHREQADVHALLPLLATYLGHTRYSDTAYYVTATAELLGRICRRWSCMSTRFSLPALLASFFHHRMTKQRNASRATLASYRDVLAFFDELETKRKNTIQTRNARLAAIRSFFTMSLRTTRQRCCNAAPCAKSNRQYHDARGQEWVHAARSELFAEVYPAP